MSSLSHRSSQGTIIPIKNFELKCFAYIWGLLTLTYLLYITSFFLGNHDYQFIRYGVSITSGVWEGRFSQFAPIVLFTKAQILPVLNTVLGFAFLSIATVILANWYNLPQKTYIILPFSLLIVTNPYIITQLYYVHTVISICLWHLLTIYALILIDKNIQKKRFSIILGAMLIFFICLSGYSSVLELALTILAGKLILDIISTTKLNKNFLLHYLKISATLLITLILYIITFSYMKENGVIYVGMYNVQTLSAPEVITKFLHNTHKPFIVLMSNIPFCSNHLIWYNSGLILLALITAHFHHCFISAFIILIAAIQALFICAYFSPYDFFQTYRIHSYSVPYFFAILYAITIRFGNTLSRNICFTISIILLCCFIKADFNIQKIWHLGTQQNEKLTERIRKDLLPQIPNNKHYRLTTIGDINGRTKFAQFPIYRNMKEFYREFFTYAHYLAPFTSGGFFLYEPQNPIWGDGWTLGSHLIYVLHTQGISSKDLIKAKIFSKRDGSDIEDQINAILQMQPWPATNYFFIGEKDIYLMIKRDNDEGTIQKLLQRLREKNK